MRIIFLMLILFCLGNAFSQNLFKIKLNNCETKKFCLDCGDKKGGCKQKEFKKMTKELSKTFNFSKVTVSGKMYFQVLIDSLGNACVLSHNDASESQISSAIVDRLNSFEYWKSAYTDGKVEEKTSINVWFLIQGNKIQSGIERVDSEKFFGNPDKL